MTRSTLRNDPTMAGTGVGTPRSRAVNRGEREPAGNQRSAPGEVLGGRRGQSAAGCDQDSAIQRIWLVANVRVARIPTGAVTSSIWGLFAQVDCLRWADHPARVSQEAARTSASCVGDCTVTYSPYCPTALHRWQ